MSDIQAPFMFSWHTTDPARLMMQLMSKAGPTLPDSVQVDGDEIASESIDIASVGQYAIDCKYHVIANWDAFNNLQISMEKPDLVKWSGGVIDNSDSVFDWFETLSFEVAFGGKRFINWPEPGTHRGQSLLPGHYPVGWLIAFKGDGHRYLISERWLEHAPVCVVKRGDLTLVQMHDLAADAATALEQAMPGWESMGVSDHGGFIPKDLRPTQTVNAQYDPEDGSLSVMVVGRDPTLRELQEACVSRNFRGAEDGNEIKKVIYTFSEPERANKHLFDLWVRGIECHAFLAGKETDLTEGYSPPQYIKPEWIQRLLERDERQASV